jgi:hypothetical protein
MKNRSVSRGSLLICVLFAWALGCSDGESTIQGNNGGGDADADAMASDSMSSDTSADEDTAEPTIESLALEPQLLELTSANGSRPTGEFDVVATYSDGSESPYSEPVSYEIDDPNLGRIVEDLGDFTASGVAGGEATVTATPADSAFGPLTATVRVQYEQTIEGDNLPADYAQKFASSQADAAVGPDVVYPLDGAVMPQNVFPADIQWNRGAQGDLFKITLSKPGAEITAFIAHTGADFKNHWLVDDGAWNVLAQTEPGEPLSIRVERWLSAEDRTVHDDSDITMSFAPGSLAGTIYYWAVQEGRIKRINDGSGTAESFMPTPPLDRTDTARCVGCHAVSNSGRYMVGRLGGGDNIGAIFDLTKDLTGNPPPTEYPLANDGSNWWFASWKPDDSRIAVSRRVPNVGDGLYILDPATGQFVTPQTGALPQTNVTHPAWAPDNSLITYVSEANEWGAGHTQGNLSVVDVQGADSFGAPRQLKTAAEVNNAPNAYPGGSAISYPTWSPDAQYIAFAHGDGGRSDRHHAALYIMKRDGTGVARLNNANQGLQTDYNFQPSFSPFEEGGYYWLSFLSRRSYGNAEVGNRGMAPQPPQIWVTAIEKNPSPGSDPSQVSYWLPGQNPRSSSISADWAPQACRPDGESCSVGSQCCSGECTPDSDGNQVCSPTPEDRCREFGETCNASSDCCSETALCLGNACVQSGG